MSEFTVVFDQLRYECADPRAHVNYERTESGIKTATNNVAHWGSLNINANCCRRFDVFVNVTGIPGAKFQAYEGTIGSCSGPVAAGTKYFSSDTFSVRCPAGNYTRFIIVIPDDPAPMVLNPWTEAEIYVELSGGRAGSSLQFADIAIDITSPSAMAATAANWQSYINYSVGATWVSVSSTNDGDGTGRTFVFDFYNNPPDFFVINGSFVYNLDETGELSVSGPTTGGSFGGNINVYLRTTWSGCDRNQITVNMHLDSDDSIVATWKNKHHGMRCGYRTVLSLTHQSCLGICDDGSVGSLGSMPETICFVPNAFAQGCGNSHYLPNNWTFTSGGNNLASSISGTSGRLSPSIQVGISGQGAGSFNSTFTVSIGASTATFTGAGGSRTFSHLAAFFTNCNTNVASKASGRATTGLLATSSTTPIFTMTGAFGTGDVYAVWFIVRYGEVSVTLPCADLTLTHSSVEFTYVAVPTGTPGPNPAFLGTPGGGFTLTSYSGVNPIPSEFKLAPSGQYYPFA